MVEGEADEVPENVALDAIMFAHKTIQPLIAMQEKLQAKAGKTKREHVVPEPDKKLVTAVERAAKTKLTKALAIAEKQARYEALDAVKAEVLEAYADPETYDNATRAAVGGIIGDLRKRLMREAVIKKGTRVDGRSTTDIRDIACEVEVLPRTHGAALFTRGETQALVTVTLGSREDEQMIDALSGVSFKGFLFH
ncbi:MAG: polyribonucleotide nucleotidyltransferase, partial [Gammaproteobacteria bacterium]|nr:polyribonucleotide nucleotidyltransferase [Gammaproteobacteria bacterium]